MSTTWLQIASLLWGLHLNYYACRQLLLVLSSGCDEYDFLVNSGHTDAFDYPINREALSVASQWGGRRLDEVPTNAVASLLDDFVQNDLIQDDLIQDDLVQDDAITQDDAVTTASEKSQAIGKCIAAFSLNTLKSWCEVCHFKFISISISDS